MDFRLRAVERRMLHRDRALGNIYTLPPFVSPEKENALLLRIHFIRSDVLTSDDKRCTFLSYWTFWQFFFFYVITVITVKSLSLVSLKSYSITLFSSISRIWAKYYLPMYVYISSFKSNNLLISSLERATFINLCYKKAVLFIIWPFFEPMLLSVPLIR